MVLDKIQAALPDGTGKYSVLAGVGASIVAGLGIAATPLAIVAAGAGALAGLTAVERRERLGFLVASIVGIIGGLGKVGLAAIPFVGAAIGTVFAWLLPFFIATAATAVVAEFYESLS